MDTSVNIAPSLLWLAICHWIMWIQGAMEEGWNGEW
jgi:hypothetical protein